MTRAAALLSALGCALAALLVREALPGDSSPMLPDAALATVASAPRPVEVPRPVGEWLASALARPLFNPDRRPEAPAGGSAVLPPLPAPPLPAPRLAGTIVGPAGRRALILADGNKLSSVAENDTVGPWTLGAIQPGAVVISGPGGVQVLRLAYGQGARAAAVALSAGPAWAWNNPCGRLHLHAGPRSATAKDAPCTFALANSGPGQ